MLNIKYKTDINNWINVNSFDKIPNDAIEIDCSSNGLTNLSKWQYLTNLQIINTCHMLIYLKIQFIV